MLSLTVSYDAPRVLFLSAPIVYGDAALVLAHRRRLATATVIGLLAVDIGYAVYMQAHGVQHGLDTNPINPVPLH